MSSSRSLALAGTLASLALGVSAQAGFSALPYSFITPANHSCSIVPAGLSCPEADPTVVDSCCQETFGGLVLTTQFWDTYTGLESKGQLLPPQTWSYHGLWPDFCNGSYTGYCDVARQFDPDVSPNVSSTGIPLTDYTGNVTATAVLTQFERFDLLDHMNKYWVSQNSPNDGFWMHEYSKHATCFSNFQTQCYGPDYQQYEDIPDFFEAAVGANLKYPTWDYLAAAGITPSNTTKYTLGQIEAALYNATGAMPYLGCSGDRFNATAAGNGTSDGGRTILTEVWHYHHAWGPISRLNYTAVNSTSRSSCATSENAISYFERTAGSEWAA